VQTEEEGSVLEDRDSEEEGGLVLDSEEEMEGVKEGVESVAVHPVGLVELKAVKEFLEVLEAC
tara:strand:+ start:143 stop:331 length:189 start_codon:yes stop_codon:yes gene_type:complete